APSVPPGAAAPPKPGSRSPPALLPQKPESLNAKRAERFLATFKYRRALAQEGCNPLAEVLACGTLALQPRLDGELRLERLVEGPAQRLFQRGIGTGRPLGKSCRPRRHHLGKAVVRDGFPDHPPSLGLARADRF